MPDDVTLRQVTEVGIAERADRIVSVIAKAESPDSKNSTTVRRIRPVNHTSVDANTDSLPRANAADVPGHLKDLYVKSTSGRSA
ncbi:hypothetical protein DPMN_137362 [Dreissena polymorpha]|uniref:Uncharacterized protein n=1 Tax=Dreissena polymorpha TaxID=45954 RepID=A0A9D4JEM6_DREPO|nr:hypothetical protein DPMN_137362 [Dreissena polymorpha]